MNFRLPNIDVPAHNPFVNCKLDREKYAITLTEIIKNSTSGFVLALDNPWGAGKTTFIRMWSQQLSDLGYKTLYFNAWENDFEDIPLAALIGELRELVSKDDDEKFHKVIKGGAQFLKGAAPSILLAALDKVVNVEMLKEGISKGLENIVDYFEEEIKDYQEKKNSINRFKEDLKDFIRENSDNGKQLIFFIDELDRCRPNYAVSILEKIKHLFSIDEIIFVLSIDKSQLENAIKGVYGVESFDSNSYLRRFIDVEYNLPNTGTLNYIRYLYQVLNFDEFIKDSKRVKGTSYRDDIEKYDFICKVLFERYKLDLRTQEKGLFHTRLALEGFPKTSNLEFMIFIFLSFLRVKEISLFRKLQFKELEIDEMQDELNRVLSSNYDQTELTFLLWLEIDLIIAYNYHRHGFNLDSIIQNTTGGGRKSPLTSRFKPNSQSEFETNLIGLATRGMSRGYSLKEILEKIDLLSRVA